MNRSYSKIRSMQYLNLIAESRYLEKKKSSRLLKEDDTQVDFYCASNVGTFNKGVIEVPKAHDGKIGYSYQKPSNTNMRKVYLIKDDGYDYLLSPGDYSADSFPGWDASNGFFERYWYCKCEGGKCKVATSDKPTEHQCKVPQGQACETKEGTTTGNQQGITGDQTGGGDCSKGPMDLVVSMGLNWKETRQKWIDAKCNGTTPCILGDATTNINLRNAICKGTWDPKTGGNQGTTPGTEQGTIPGTGNQQGDDKQYSEEYITPTFGQTPKAD